MDIAPLLPSSLNKGDCIGVFAPSSFVDQEDIENSVRIIESLGYKVFVHPQTYERENQSAGSHLQKSLAFQGLWQRKDIKAIWAAGGGNRCMHLLDMINFKHIAKNPKILIGFSDVTALLNSVYAHTGVITFHGPVFKNLHKYKETNHLISLLEGNKDTSYPLEKINILRNGMAQGHLVGGNLSLFQYLPQTLPNDFYKGSILFLEDCNEELSRIDRMLLHLKRLGVLKQIKGLVLGQFSSMTDSGHPFGYTLEDIIEEHIEGLDIPVLYNMPFGHDENLYTLPIGGNASIDTADCTFKLNGTAVTQLP